MKKLVLIGLCGVCLGALALLAWTRLGARPRRMVPRLDVVCGSCGWEGKVSIHGRWRACPSCGKRSVKLASVCPKCGKVMPFLNDELYLANPRAAIGEHADEVLPLCPECDARAVPKWVAHTRIIRAQD